MEKHIQDNTNLYGHCEVNLNSGRSVKDTFKDSFKQTRHLVDQQLHDLHIDSSGKLGKSRISFSIDPRLFARMTLIPLLPTQTNKLPNFSLIAKITGDSNSYNDLGNMYKQDQVTWEQYNSILNSGSFGLLTGAKGSGFKDSASLVCLDADAEKVNGAKVGNLDQSYTDSMKQALFDDGMIITGRSQSGNEHIYGVSSSLTNQSTKGWLFRNGNTRLELDIKTTNNYVLIHGGRYGDLEINSDLNQFLKNSKEMITKAAKLHHVDFMLEIFDTVFAGLSSVDKIRTIMTMASMVHANIFIPQNFDSKVGTNLIKIKGSTLSKSGSKKQQYGNSTSSKKQGAQNKDQQFNVNEHDAIFRFKRDVLQEKIDQFNITELTNAYHVGNRGSTIMRIASFAKMSMWDKERAYKFCYELDAKNPNGLIADGLADEIRHSVNQGYKEYRPDAQVINEAFGHQMYPHSKRIAKDGTDYIYHDAKDYLDRMKFHNNSWVEAILVALRDKVFEVGNHFSFGDSGHFTAKEMVKYINENLMYRFGKNQYHVTEAGFRRFMREFMIPMTSGLSKAEYKLIKSKSKDYHGNHGFDYHDLYQLLVHKLSHHNQDDVNTGKLQLAVSYIDGIKEVVPMRELVQQSVMFDHIKETNSQLLGYLTIDQIFDILSLKITSSKGVKGGYDVKVIDMSDSRPFHPDDIRRDRESKSKSKKEVELLLQVLKTKLAQKWVARVKTIEQHAAPYEVGYRPAIKWRFNCEFRNETVKDVDSSKRTEPSSLNFLIFTNSSKDRFSSCHNALLNANSAQATQTDRSWRLRLVGKMAVLHGP